MPSLGNDARGMPVHDELSRLQPMDAIELLLDIWLYRSLLGKLGLRRVLLLFEHVDHAQDNGSHGGEHEPGAYVLLCLSKDGGVQIFAACTDLLSRVPRRLASRPVLRQRTLLVHI